MGALLKERHFISQVRIIELFFDYSIFPILASY